MTQIYSVRTGSANIARMLIGTDPDKKRASTSRELTSKELMIARRMARDISCNIRDIAAAIKWDRTLTNLQHKLKKVNIVCVGGRLGGHLNRIDTRRV